MGDMKPKTDSRSATAPRKAAPRGRPSTFAVRREEVVRTAARCFSDFGVRHTTMEDVAGAMKLTPAALYHYAKSKDELVSACAEASHKELMEALEGALRFKTGREQLAAFFRRYGEIVTDDYGRCFVLINLNELGPKARTQLKDRQRFLDGQVRAMIRRGVKDGSLRAANEADVSLAMFGAVNSLARWRRSDGGRTAGKIAEDLVLIFLNGVAA